MKTSLFSKLLIISPFVMTAPPVGAQNAADKGSETLEEVLVTATRRAETDILRTPIAMTMLTDKDIEMYAMRDLNDIALSVPGLSSGTVSAFKSAQFSMRGVTETTIILYKESPVGVTIDDFVIPHIQTSNLEMFDIEAVEVLRGPQGTLFGKNTTGGVINVRTKRPVLGENTVEVRGHFGDFGTTKGNIAANFGSETLAARFSGMYLKSDGYYKNTATYGPLGTPVPVDPTHDGTSGAGDGRDLGGDDVFSGRAKLLFSPSDELNLLLQYEIVRDEGDSPPIVNESTAGYLAPLWGFHSATGDPIDNAGSTLRDDLLLNLSRGHRVDIDGIYLNGDYDFGGHKLFFNLGSRDQESRLPSSYGGTTAPQSMFDATRDDNRTTRQAEVRLVSNNDGAFQYVIGGFYQEDETEFCVLQVVGFLDNFFLGTPPDFFNQNPLILCNAQDADAKALFVDGTFQATDNLQISAGVRYTREEKAWAGRPRVNVFLLDGAPTLDQLGEPINGVDFNRYPTGVVRNSKSWSEPTYRLNFAYDFSEETMGFAKYSRGFKSGGYNDQLGTQLNPITDLAAQPTEPEIADSFEVGLKSSLGEGRASVALNSYYVEYTDAQRTFNVSFPGGGQETLFFNAAEMTVKGVEFEGAFQVTDRFSLRGSASWMDAVFDKFEADTNFDGVIDVDLSSQPVTRAPKWMATAEGRYALPLNNGSDLNFALRVSYEDDSVSSYSDVDPAFNTTLQEKTLVDASVTYTDSQDRFYVKALANNITDERYRTGALSVATIWIMTAYGPPRYFGLEVGAKFGGR
ncbi:MAG: TonB-dependent receptor [Gammaproteobacteria bacterium]|nr:TonB-dependent receptor [Gammaproteobacteria bacterium]